jgi:hypothetical protein
VDDIRPALQFLGVLLALSAAAWLWTDAKSLQRRGVNLMPELWACSGFLLCALAVPLYLLLRFTHWHEQLLALEAERRPAGSEVFLVSCMCGRKRTVSAVCAGVSLPCSCGGNILVPPLDELRRQQPESRLDSVGPSTDASPVLKESGLGMASFLIGAVVGMLEVLAYVFGAMLAGWRPGTLKVDSPIAVVLGLGMLGGAAISVIGLGLGVAALCHPRWQTRFAVAGVVVNSLILIGVSVLVLIGHRLASG